MYSLLFYKSKTRLRSDFKRKCMECFYRFISMYSNQQSGMYSYSITETLYEPKYRFHFMIKAIIDPVCYFLDKIDNLVKLR